MTTQPDTQPLYSEFASDPDMADLVEMFVDELQDRVNAINQALNATDTATLTQLAHQLKGAAGGYGFTPITEAASTLEQLVKSQADDASVRDAAEQLTSLCSRATADAA